MKTIHRDIVAALVFSKDGKLFMGMKDPLKGGVYADCWHIPGGGVDAGETKLQALRRELKEEIGLDANSTDFQLIDDTCEGESIKIIDGEEAVCKMKFFVYGINLNRNAKDIHIQLNDDLIKYKWITLNNLEKYKLTPPSILLFKKLGYIKQL
jgi:8-oxo-dGTP pyrophosphatase MutT (NUDIX family)